MVLPTTIFQVLSFAKLPFHDGSGAKRHWELQPARVKSWRISERPSFQNIPERIATSTTSNHIVSEYEMNSTHVI